MTYEEEEEKLAGEKAHQESKEHFERKAEAMMEAETG